MRLFIGLVKFVVTLLVILMWTVVGFVLWIPFLTRMMLVFIGAIMASIYTRKDPTTAQHGLERAIRFWPEGYQLIFQSMGQNLPQGMYVEPELDLKRIFLELLFAIVFWAGLTISWWISIQWGIVKFSSFTTPSFSSSSSTAPSTNSSSTSPPPTAVRSTPFTEGEFYAMPASLQSGWLNSCGGDLAGCKEADTVLFRLWCRDPRSEGRRGVCVP